MRKIRTCKGSRMNTGSSACSIDWKKVKDGGKVGGVMISALSTKRGTL